MPAPLKEFKDIAPFNKLSFMKDTETKVSPAQVFSKHGNFVIGDAKDTSIFQEGEDICFLPSNATWEDISVALGVFPSKGQAKKNGWQGEVPEGFTSGWFGNHPSKGSVFIWKQTNIPFDLPFWDNIELLKEDFQNHRDGINSFLNDCISIAGFNPEDVSVNEVTFTKGIDSFIMAIQMAKAIHEEFDGRNKDQVVKFLKIATLC